MSIPSSFAVLLVSSQATTVAREKVSISLEDASPRLPIGVPARMIMAAILACRTPPLRLHA